MARTAAERRQRYVGFEVIRDTVEIDESLADDDSISIEDCFGFVLVEVPKPTPGGLTDDEIMERALELANESVPYGIENLSWNPAYEGGGAFIRFTVDSWEQISRSQRDEDNEAIRAEERSDARREARLD